MTVVAPFLLLTALAGTTSTSTRGLAEALQRGSAADYAGAAAALAPDADGRRCGAPLEPYCAFYRGEALFYSGRYEEAAAELRAARDLDPAGPVAVRALGREGEALLRSGHAHDAAARLREAMASRPSPALQLSLAEALLGEGDAAGAIAQWRRILVASPEDPAATVASKHLEQQGALAALSFQDNLARAERLLAAGQVAQALASARTATREASTEAERFHARLVLGKALAASSEDGEAEKTFQSIAVPRAPPKLQMEALLALGRGAMGRGAPAEAIAHLSEICRRFPSDGACDEAAFLSAWIAFNQGDYRGCTARFDAFVEEHRKARRRSDGLWYLGFCHRLAGDLAAADRAFLDLERSSSALAPQALYWRARGARSPQAAEPLYRQLAHAAPTSWYAWLARRRLAELGLAAEPFTLSASESFSGTPSSEREARAAQLAALGLMRDADAEMAAVASSAKGTAEVLRMAGICASMGLHARAYQLANGRLWSAALDKKEPAALSLLFPRAYSDTVRASAEAVRIDPYFIWAIMRRESGFDPLAVSPARAFGLMQMLAPTAEKIAHLAGEERPGLESLQRPERSVPLAAWYLAELTGIFGHTALAAAAYNGSPRAVARWASERDDMPIDEFVELIPFRETRFYVKGVLGDYFTYRALWSAPGDALPFCERVPKPTVGVAF